MLQKDKGQSAVEFIIIVGFFAFAFLIFLLVLHQNTASERAANRNILVQDVALDVQQEIALAFESINGYSRQFTLPPKISGSSYTIRIVGQTTLYINTTDGVHALSLPVANVSSGNLIIGVNTIRKINDTIRINS